MKFLRNLSIPLFLVVVLCFGITRLVAQDKPGDLNDPLKMTDKFFADLLANKAGAAYDGLMRNSPLAQNPTEIQNMKDQTTQSLTMYGKVVGYELVDSHTYGKSIMRVVYILKSEKRPFVWEFYFYKPQNEWTMATYSYNDTFKSLDSPPLTPAQ